MKVQVTPLVTPGEQVAGWALTPEGSPVLKVIASGVEVLIDFGSIESCRDVCVDGCFAAVTALQRRQGNGAPKGMPSNLVGLNGLPLGLVR